ncbi:aspartic peptidase domain-containing protein [Xylaria digitata]|nr:aspartic peptidase domain-containing protein [Xylaria digitata]
MILLSTLHYLFLLLFALPFRSGAASSYEGTGFLSLPIRAGATPAHPHRPIDRRDEDIYSVLYGNSSSTQYFIQLYFGDLPNQPVEVALVTDYNDFWINPNCYNAYHPSECKSRGFYDPNKSWTSINTQVNGSISYVDGSGADFTYYTDKVSLSSGRGPSNVRFGVATNSKNIDSGVLGLGLGAASKNGGERNFIDQLADQQFTNSRAFSLALGNGASNDEGVIIFGGIDTKRFSGELTANAILPPQGNNAYARYSVQMTSLGLVSPDGAVSSYGSSANSVVDIDAGTTYTYVPDDLIPDIYNDLQAAYYDDEVVAPCAQRENNFQFKFTIGSTAINVPFSEFLTMNWNETLCYVGILPSRIDRPTLGLTFLRSAYLVFDQTRNEILMQQFVNCGTNEQALLGSGANGIVGECNATGSATPSGNTPTAYPTAEITPSLSGDTWGLSTGKKAGVGVGATIGGLLMISLLYYLVRFCRPKAAGQGVIQPSGAQDVYYHSPQLQYPPQGHAYTHTPGGSAYAHDQRVNTPMWAAVNKQLNPLIDPMVNAGAAELGAQLSPTAFPLTSSPTVVGSPNPWAGSMY